MTTREIILNLIVEIKETLHCSLDLIDEIDGISKEINAILEKTRNRIIRKETKEGDKNGKAQR